MPTLKKLQMDNLLSEGIVRTAFPTFTNPNNVSIMTGQPPSKSGICGNFYLNTETKEEVMMNTTDLIRCDSLFAKLAEIGTQVTIVTAKDKLREMLSFQCPKNHIGSNIKPTKKTGVTHTPSQDGVLSSSTSSDSSSLIDDVRCFSVEALNHNIQNKDLTGNLTALVGRPAPSIYEHDCSK